MKESPEEKRQRLIELAKASVTSAYSTGEHSVILAVNTSNELERARNLIHEKLEEWYGIFFPELRLNNQISYAHFVSEFGMDKKAADKEQLTKLLGSAADEVIAKASNSIGREPSETEYAMLKKIADYEIGMAKMQEDIDVYLKERATAMMPNITYLVDFKIAAELLAKAGSLSKMAFMPAGTIQLLGAEKALFKHIKFNSKPPKYGILFKLPQITTANKLDRGRIARLYATKICIAAKADAFTKNFIAPKLKEAIEATIEKYKTQPRKPKPMQQQRRNDYRPNRFKSNGNKSFRNNRHGGRDRRQR